MDESNTSPGGPPTRSDVGYKRPPREHQFKKGQPRPPRRKKVVPTEEPLSETLYKVLGEMRRVEIAGKVLWISGADFVVKRAWQEAAKGSATLRREIMRLLLSCEAPPVNLAPLILTDPSAPTGSTGFRLMPVEEGKS